MEESIETDYQMRAKLAQKREAGCTLERFVRMIVAVTRREIEKAKLKPKKGSFSGR